MKLLIASCVVVFCTLVLMLATWVLRGCPTWTAYPFLALCSAACAVLGRAEYKNPNVVDDEVL